MEIKIPKFLLRKKTKKQKPKDLGSVAFGRERVNKHDEWNKIKTKKYGDKHTIFLYDEAPRIGSGFRVVYVKEGRKWAHIVSQAGDPHTSDKIKVRMTLKMWKSILDRSKKRGIDDLFKSES